MKKILVVLIALVMLAGVANAGLTHSGRIYDETASGIAPNPIDILPGQTVVLSYHAESVLPSAIGQSTPYGFQVLSASNGGSVSDLTATFANVYAPTSSPEYDDVGVMKLTLNPAAPVGAVYEFKIYAGEDIVTSYASASREVHSIPEFPTVALPVAAILGLAFFMQRRKEE